MHWFLKLATSRVTLIAIAVVGVVLTLKWLEHKGYERGVEDEKQRQLAAMTKVFGDMRKRHEEELRIRGWQDEEEAKADRLARNDLQLRLDKLMTMPPKVLIQTKVVKDESGCSCPVVSLGDEFWMPYRAAGARGGTADPAATDSVQDRM